MRIHILLLQCVRQNACKPVCLKRTHVYVPAQNSSADVKQRFLLILRGASFFGAMTCAFVCVCPTACECVGIIQACPQKYAAGSQMLALKAVELQNQLTPTQILFSCNAVMPGACNPLIPVSPCGLFLLGQEERVCLSVVRELYGYLEVILQHFI